MIFITLICNAGLSTSMLAHKMQQSAEMRKLDIDVVAVPINDFLLEDRPTDILLLGPQIDYMFEEMKLEYQDKAVTIGCINTLDFGLMNGEKVLDFALDLLEDWK